VCGGGGDGDDDDDEEEDEKREEESPHFPKTRALTTMMLVRPLARSIVRSAVVARAPQAMSLPSWSVVGVARGSRLLCTVPKPNASTPPPAGTPVEPPFVADTPASRRIFLASVAGFVAFTAYVGLTAYESFFSSKGRQKAEDAVASIPLFKGNPVVFMEFEVDGRPAGRITLQLRKDVAPVAAGASRLRLWGRVVGVPSRSPAVTCVCARVRELPCAVHGREGLRLC
jgi:hypothetical protein